MSRRQLIFDQLFRGQIYGPRGDFDPRDWQMDCADSYSSSVDSWLNRRDRNGSDSQHRYCIYAGTGSGKTKAVGLIACHMLNRKLASQIVIVCPNRSIRRKTQKDFRHYFGIDLVVFHARKHADGIPRTKQGYILTYAHLIHDPTLHLKICSHDTLVIFDEVHHLGDKSGWGESAIKAYGCVDFVVTLTGTPYRSDNNPIPFVTYEATEVNGLVRFRADGDIGFTYPLGRAIADAVCREPMFTFHGDENTVISIRTHPDAPEILATFDTKVISDALSALRLRGAVQYGSVTRRTFLKESLERCREERRKVVIFLGGDTEGDHTPTVDATELLPSELRELGIGDDEFEIVTGDDKEAQAKIENFGASKKWILISINMVSEGTDIPELSAAVFLTTVTAKQTTIQRIGRVLRLMGPQDSHKNALIFMFKDPNLFAIRDEIKKEVDVEVELARTRKGGTSEVAEGKEPSRYRSEAIGISGGEATLVTLGNQSWPIEVFKEKARSMLVERGVTPSMLEVALTLMLGEGNVVR